MNALDLKNMSVNELLQGHAAIINELRAQGVLRSKNNPVGDYCEWLVAETLKLTLAIKSTLGYDAVDAAGSRYQIKGRHVTSDNKSRQLGAIRNLDDNNFDFLIGVLLNDKFQVKLAVQVPLAVVQKHAKFKEHTNAHILHLQGKFLDDALVENITRRFTATPAHPESFDLFIGGYMGASYGLRLEDGNIIYERFKQGYKSPKKDVLDPSTLNWEAFEAELDKLKAWAWDASYVDPDTMDGTHWNVDIQFGGKRLIAKGSNAFPKRFNQFCSAVSGLIDGRRFA